LFTTASKDRLSVLDVLRNGRPRTFLLNGEAERWPIRRDGSLTTPYGTSSSCGPAATRWKVFGVALRKQLSEWGCSLTRAPACAAA
jgi:hypothetical protein